MGTGATSMRFLVALCCILLGGPMAIAEREGERERVRARVRASERATMTTFLTMRKTKVHEIFTLPTFFRVCLVRGLMFGE